MYGIEVAARKLDAIEHRAPVGGCTSRRTEDLLEALLGRNIRLAFVAISTTTGECQLNACGVDDIGAAPIQHERLNHSALSRYARCRLDQCRGPIGFGDGIVIQQGNPLAGASQDAAITRFAEPEVLGLLQLTYVRKLRLDHFGRTVRGTVIHDDEL